MIVRLYWRRCLPLPPPGAILAALLLPGMGANPCALAAVADEAATRGQGASGERRPPLTRLELALGGGWRQDRAEDGGIDARASGTALSSLAARLAWWRPGAPLGLAAEVQAARFTLSGAPGVAALDPVDLIGADATAALALRAGSDHGFGLEAQLGYGVHRIPAVVIGAGPAGDLRLHSGGPRGHGPRLALGVRRPLGRRLALELGGQGLPVLLGARYQGRRVWPWRLEGRVALTVALAELGGTRLSASLAYEPSVTGARGDQVHLSQQRQQVALGLAARWGRPAAQPSPAPAVVAPAVPRPSTINGLVRAEEDGQAVAARITIVELALEVSADARGAFHLEVPPGQYTLQIEAPGFLTQTKPLRTAAGEQRIYNVDLQRERP